MVSVLLFNLRHRSREVIGWWRERHRDVGKGEAIRRIVQHRELEQQRVKLRERFARRLSEGAR